MNTIVVLHPGEMGAAVGACLAGRGHRVMWVSEERGQATRARAAVSGLVECASLAGVLETVDFVLSICPPQYATEVARKVARRNAFRGIYVDANAVARTKACDIGRLIQDAGATFVDGSIIGPPAFNGRTRLYLAGRSAQQVAALFDSTQLEARVLAAEAGAASALKMCYAAWSKGATALLAAVRALAQHEGVDECLLGEWRQSQPDAPARSEAVDDQARKAWRWTAEMEEIAASFEAAGLPNGFHHAAAELFGRVARFKNTADGPSLSEVMASLLREAGERRVHTAHQHPNAQKTSTLA
jgi:3-hydroxyisobutyrate dehydrogenase-like beta-hydroxyacid dehydrogenase